MEWSLAPANSRAASPTQHCGRSSTALRDCSPCRARQCRETRPTACVPRALPQRAFRVHRRKQPASSAGEHGERARSRASITLYKTSTKRSFSAHQRAFFHGQPPMPASFTDLASSVTGVLAPWDIRSQNPFFSKNGCPKEPAQELRSAPLRMAPLSLALLRLASLRAAPMRLASLRSGFISGCSFRQWFHVTTPCSSISRCCRFATVFSPLPLAYWDISQASLTPTGGGGATCYASYFAGVARWRLFPR